MRVPVLAILTMALVGSGAALAEPRERGTGDTSRHPPRVERAPVRTRNGGDRGLTRMEKVDPAVRQFWSDRCVDQRRSGLTHSKDCDNPAYTGGSRYYEPYSSYDYYDGYGSPGYAPRGYVPRGGASLKDPRGGWGRQEPGSRGRAGRPTRGGSFFRRR